MISPSNSMIGWAGFSSITLKKEEKLSSDRLNVVETIENVPIAKLGKSQRVSLPGIIVSSLRLESCNLGGSEEPTIIV